MSGRTTWSIREGDASSVLRSLDAQSVQCCVTSPPYWGLRDYGHDGQIGLEKTPAEYVEKLVAVFHDVRRVLRDDGVLWVNLGDSYAASASGKAPQGSMRLSALSGGKETGERAHADTAHVDRLVGSGLKPKDLVGIPWSVAFALRADGWYLRSDVIWAKPNPMPESVTDRPTKAHEYLFLLSKSERYHYDADAVAEPAVAGANGSTFTSGKTFAAACVLSPVGTGPRADKDTRNARSVWTIPSEPFSGAHFATFPSELPRRCIAAGTRPGHAVLDPFAGSGTTGVVATGLGRSFVGIELNATYADMARRRIRRDGAPLLALEVA